MKIEDRENKMFWVWCDNKLSYEKGYYCKPYQKEYDGKLWWFPKLGYTLWLDIQCFDNKERAIEIAITLLDTQIIKLKEIKSKLKGQG